jgi:hypothetical protein
VGVVAPKTNKINIVLIYPAALTTGLHTVGNFCFVKSWNRIHKHCLGNFRRDGLEAFAF